MLRWLALFCWVVTSSAYGLTPAQQILLEGSGPSLSCNFLGGQTQTAGTISVGPKCPTITFTRASTATSALFTDAAGASFTTYSSGVARLMTQGFLVEQQVENYFLNSNTPATQLAISLTTGTYVFFCNGTGSFVLAAVSAVGTGFGTQGCSTGTYETIVITTSGTVSATLTGSASWADLQGNAFPTSHIVTTGSAATRSADAASLAVGPWFNQNTGTLLAQYQTIHGIAAASEYAAQIDDGAVNNRYALRIDASGTQVATFLTESNLTITISASLATNAIGVPSAIAMAWNSSGQRGRGWGNSGTNGSSATTASAVPIDILTTLWIGSATGNNAANAFIQSVEVWRYAQTDSQLRVSVQ